MNGVRPRRSVLYMPASNERALEKAKSLPADVLIFDLEDAVSPDAKESARARAVQAAQSRGYGRREIVVRINSLSGPWGHDDLAAIARSGADGVCIPKVQSADELPEIRRRLSEAGAPPELAIWAMMETPFAVLNAKSIAAAAVTPRNPLTVFVLGTNDLIKETRAVLTPDRYAMLPWLSQCVLAARAFDLDILDSVYNDFGDLTGFERECRQGRELGMDGKTLIHPSQIEVANGVFMPDEAEIAWARKVIAAFDEPQNAGKAVITLDGRMVELLHRDMAQRTVALADAVIVAEEA